MTNKGWKASKQRSGAEMLSEELSKRYTKRTTATANSPFQNIWSVAEEIAYKDLARKLLDELRRRLSFAWKKVI